MSNYESRNVASVIHPPLGEVVISDEAIRQSLCAVGVGYIVIGRADTYQRELPLDERGIAYVAMNETGKLTLAPEQDGVIATSAIAGCTGVAGFAKRKDGGVATFVSHYDPMCQNSLYTGDESPINRQLYGFRYEASNDDLDGPISYVVAYDSSEHRDPYFGQRRGVFKNWRYLDQIHVTTGLLGEDVQVLLLPYQRATGETLASGRKNGSEGIFWNGVKVNFDEYFANPASSSTAIGY